MRVLVREGRGDRKPVQMLPVAEEEKDRPPWVQDRSVAE